MELSAAVRNYSMAQQFFQQYIISDAGLRIRPAYTQYRNQRGWLAQRRELLVPLQK